MNRHYSTWILIDRARLDQESSLATALNAEALERQARDLDESSASDRVWLAGTTSDPALDRVVSELLALRKDPVSMPASPPIEPVTRIIRVGAPTTEPAD